MSYNYIIDQFLKIEHNHGICIVELEQIEYDCADDDRTYTKLSELDCIDFIIYTNNSFVKEEYKSDYLHHIEKKVGMRVNNTSTVDRKVKIPDIATLKTMDDIIQITKFSVSYTKDYPPMYHYMYYEDSDSDSDDGL